VTSENSMKSTVACWWLGYAAYALQLLDWLFTGGYAFDETSLLPQTYCTFLYVGTAHQEMRVAAGDDIKTSYVGIRLNICKAPALHMQLPVCSFTRIPPAPKHFLNKGGICIRAMSFLFPTKSDSRLVEYNIV
jgi:hypothetical protein